MNRRSFVSTLLASAATADLLAQSQTSAVKRVLVVFKCHLDVGFVDTQAAIIRKYFDQHYPRAIALAATMRDAGSDRYVWTTGSWLLYSYLQQATPEQMRQMEQAIARGDIAWHALPFTWQSELLDRSAITGCIGFSKALDKRFDRKTTGAKMTDVPGHTRGLVGPLAGSGITFLDIGVNAASTPPDVPALFVWKDVDGAQLTVMYHRTAYGGVVRVPESDLAIAVQVRDDNSGPHTLEEVHKIYSELRAQYPAAEIRAANLSEIANAIEPYQSHLPVFTQGSATPGFTASLAILSSLPDIANFSGSVPNGSPAAQLRPVINKTSLFCKGSRLPSNIRGAPTPKPGWTSTTTPPPPSRPCSTIRNIELLPAVGSKSGKTSKTASLLFLRPSAGKRKHVWRRSSPQNPICRD
jgi:hypothetical protein